MNYSNAQVRRQDRLLEESDARELLREGEYGVLSLQTEEGGGYGVPVSYVWDGSAAMYVHCAREGRKLRCLDACARVSFCVVGATRIVPEKFTTAYRSLILSCLARRVAAEDECLRAFDLLLEKYSPNDLAAGRTYARSALHRTTLLRLDIETWSGKGRRTD